MVDAQCRSDLFSKAKEVRWLLTDCDGVLTDGGVYYGESGEALKRFSIRDGMGVQRLAEIAGVQTGIVTGELSPSVKHRAEKLKIEELHLGAKDKVSIVKDLAKRRGIELSQIAYIGDDVNDLEVLEIVGLSACPNDAMEIVQSKVNLVCEKPGGHGAFREFCEFILKAKS